MADTGNEHRGPSGGHNRALNGQPPSYAPSDNEWATGDFSSLDLGDEAGDTSARPMRRLDLPPLVQADGPDTGDRPTSLGMFASVPDDENLTVTSSAGTSERSLRPVREEVPPSAAFQPVDAPKHGAPPHPLAGAGHDQAIRQGPDPTRAMDPRAYVGGYEPDSAGYDDPFASVDRRQTAGRPGRPPLELAPPVVVEENRSAWVIPVAAILGVLALAAGYFMFFRGNSDDATLAADSDDLAADLVEDDLEGDGTADPADTADPTASTDPAAPTVLSDSPVLTLQGAADGPLEVETKYEMAIEGVPNGSTYLVVVDGIPQEPALDYLPVLILPEGRHSISVTVTSGADTAETNPVEVYVLAPELTATHRANLSSVSMAEQGWSEAMKQFDEFREAGHENLMLSPSDPYPSLLPGFYNLYVAGFADADAATAYCQQFNLAIPDDCYPAPFDPNGPPRDG